MTGHRNLLLFATSLALLLGGCAAVKTYDRGNLADRIMQWDDHPQEELYDSHMYRARAQGVQPVQIGGGGCGCEQ